MMDYAPIALFVYNRPWHTRQTVEALQNNFLAKESELYIFSDGPKSADDELNVQEVRKYIREISGFKKIVRTEREKNLGLANSIITGVTELVNQYGKIIVLEDDLVSSPYFLTYMNDALKIYVNDDRVMHIAAYMYPLNTRNLPETFFYRASSCWGWGTWARAWKFFNNDIEALSGQFTKRMIRDFTLDGTMDFWKQMEMQKTGRINSWAIRWYASVFLKRGLCLHPSVSLIKNIGFDGSGIHCGGTDIYDVTVRTSPVNFFECKITESTVAINKIKKYMTHVNPGYFRRKYLAIISRFFSR